MKHRSAARRVRGATVPLALALAVVTGITVLLIRAPNLHLGLDMHMQESQSRQISPKQAPGLELTGTIFVSISSYRDDECSYTVQHMFDQADVPERVFVGVCEQNWRPRESCQTGHLPLKLRDHVQYVSVNASEAKGPTYGRALSQKLFAGQDFYLQIDSHTQFAPGWDRRLIEMYQKLRGCVSKPVLSHYPASSEDLNDKEVPRICNVTFLGDVEVWRLWEAENQLPMGQFVPTPFAAAGFMFFAGSVLTEVPFDPQLPYLFDGEEILYSARLWTHGWDIFTPVENLIFHHYERKKAKSVYSDHEEEWWPEEQRTLVKVRYMLNISSVPPNETFVDTMRTHGLGEKRSLAEYYTFANVDIATNTSNAWKKFCGPNNGRPPNACLAAISAPIDEARLAKQIADDLEARRPLPEEPAAPPEIITGPVKDLTGGADEEEAMALEAQAVEVQGQQAAKTAAGASEAGNGEGASVDAAGSAAPEAASSAEGPAESRSGVSEQR